MRMLVTRLAVLVAGVLLGGGALYALGAGSVLVVPLAAVAAVVLGEVYFLFADGDGPV